MALRIAIRDDDTCFFTRPGELEAVYAPLGEWLPVSLAVTPFAVEAFHLGDAVRFYQGIEPQPLAANGEMCAYLRESIARGRFSVLCHGYTHAYARLTGGALVQECVWKSPRRLTAEAALAKSVLEQTLGCRVRTFVPPGNAISLRAAEGIGRSFPRLLTTIPLRRWREFLAFPSGWAALARRAWGQVRHGAPPPRPERVAGVWFLPSISLTGRTSWQDLVRYFDLCRRTDAGLVVAVHYWELEGEVRSLFYRFLEYASARGAEFVHCDQLFPGGGLPAHAGEGDDAPAGALRRWRPAFPPPRLPS
ncbi:MAG: DUF2334 domain-containing protein [Bryobacterales bacterium]|nr:DUF2334 domain-containing protein [Bryobacterales bacterium]